MGQKNYNFDAFMLVADGAAAYTASGIGQVSSANKILDLGGALTRTDIGLTGGLARMDPVCVIDVSAITTANANNIYDLIMMGSNNSNGSSPVVLGRMTLGNTAALPNGATTSVAGRYELPFVTEQADINYEFVFLYVLVAGTTPSISLRAFLAPFEGSM